jgi:hypothetical protein
MELFVKQPLQRSLLTLIRAAFDKINGNAE